MKDNFNSRELVSSKGEKIYVNSLNWGDNQISIISTNKNRLKNISDTNNVIRGLEPFVYNFKNDRLVLYFKDTVRYRIIETFKTIDVSYEVLDYNEYYEIKYKSFRNDGYFSIPMQKKTTYSKDMPLPPPNEN